MQEILSELNAYVQHKDYQLYRRRLLDAAYETQNDTLIDEAIGWSLQTPKEEGDNTLAWLNSGTRLLQKVAEKIQHAGPAKRVQLVKADNLTKQYAKSVFSLKPFHVEIYSGDIIGIVGENGNGKTTLLRCLAGQLRKSTGDISYFGIESSDDFYSIKHKVAFIPQRIPRWFGLLKDNLHFSAAISGIHGKENDRMVHFMLERLNLTKFANLTWDKISSGYRTRFEIARILLQKPNLLILDEPLANLDIHAQQTLLSDLQFLVKSPTLNLGVILSSQQLHEVEKVADKVLLIKDGNCFWNNDLMTESDIGELVVELETTTDRTHLAAILPSSIAIAFNGNFYTLSGHFTAKELLATLSEKNVDVLYFRNITHSTKRFF